MIFDTDVWRASEEMIRLFASDANIHAAMRADKALDEGDTDGFHFWKKVEATLRPRVGEQRN